MRLPIRIEQLLEDAGYEGRLVVLRRDGMPINKNDEAHLLGMMKAIDVDLEEAKARDA